MLLASVFISFNLNGLSGIIKELYGGFKAFERPIAVISLWPVNRKHLLNLSYIYQASHSYLDGFHSCNVQTAATTGVAL